MEFVRFIDKPAYASPCNRCGACCVRSICTVGQIVFQEMIGPCPALRFNPATMESACGLTFPEETTPEIAKSIPLLLGMGNWCDSQIHEPENEEFEAIMDAHNEKHKKEHHSAIRLLIEMFPCELGKDENVRQIFSIVGEKFTERGEATLKTIRPGASIALVREPNNPADPFAVMVWSGDTHLGYIPKAKNRLIAALIDSSGQEWCRPLIKREFAGAMDGQTTVNTKAIGGKFLLSSNSAFPQVEIE